MAITCSPVEYEVVTLACWVLAGAVYIGHREWEKWSFPHRTRHFVGIHTAVAVEVGLFIGAVSLYVGYRCACYQDNWWFAGALFLQALPLVYFMGKMGFCLADIPYDDHIIIHSCNTLFGPIYRLLRRVMGEQAPVPFCCECPRPTRIKYNPRSLPPLESTLQRTAVGPKSTEGLSSEEPKPMLLRRERKKLDVTDEIAPVAEAPSVDPQ